jgi:mRNA-degrading endonuclease toxin of MazEF toxin-antitoxin module
MERGDVYFVDLDPTQGREQRGHRPVFIITPAAFNRLGLQLVAPLTTGGAFARHKGFAVELTGKMRHIQGVVLCNQLRILDIPARDGRFVERAPQAIVDEVLARVSTLIS